MRVLVAWPTVDVKEANITAARWKNQGYDTALFIEHSIEQPSNIDHYIIGDWKGFPSAANKLCQAYVDLYDIIIISGNDLYPDTKLTAQEIGNQFMDHFHGTNGIMHPVGDKYGLIMEAAVCPWIGADYIKSVYGGRGPYYEGYYHYFCDGELQDVATLNNTFWQRDDLIQYHAHWSRMHEKRPAHLMPALTNHADDQATYHARKEAGFPGVFNE